MTKRLRMKSLLTKIIIFMGLPVILSASIVGIVILSLVRLNIEELTERELTAKSQTASKELEAYFDEYRNRADQMANNVQFQKFFENLKQGTSITSPKDFADIKQTLINTEDDSIAAVWIADVDSSQLAQSDGFVSDSSYIVKERPWFQLLKEAKKSILTEPFEDFVTKEQIVSIIAPVYGPGGQELIGAVGIDFSLSGIKKTIGNYQLGKTGYYVLTSRAGQIIYHPESDVINHKVTEANMSENIQNALLTAQEGAVPFTSYGTAAHGYVCKIGDTGWTVLAGLPNHEFYEMYNKITKTMILIFGFAVLIIGVIMVGVSKGIISPLKKLTNTANLIADGRLDIHAEVQSSDETGQLAIALNRTVVQLNHYIDYIHEITKVLTTMATGDMRIKLEQEYKGEFAPIKEALLGISDALNRTLLMIRNTSDEVSIGADQVASGAQVLASGSTEQASTVEELSASIIQVSDQAGQNVNSVKKAFQYVKEAGAGLKQSNQHMDRLNETMNEISESSEKISNITKVIEDIAFQTNILALNAAVEAARAGEAGKGFAVVADEVRNLAGKSAEAAKQTADLIGHSESTIIQGETAAKETAHILKEVGERAQMIIDVIREIDLASQEQANAIRQINQGLFQVSSVIQNNAATAEESSAASEELAGQAQALKEEVGKFKLDNNK